MSDEKQIEEMAEYIFGNAITHDTRFKEDCRSIARDLYAAEYRKQAWISVEDALPQSETERVLVSLEDVDFTKPIGVNKIDTDRYVGGVWVRWGRYVTQWMPLPEPPKGEEHE